MDTKPTREEVYEFLDKLRESGETNMMNSPTYLMREFKMNSLDARDWFLEWSGIGVKS